MCIIDTTSMTNFKLEKANQFLSIIQTIINKKTEATGIEPVPPI